ncbi:MULTISPECIES: hypothetical protein [unclassified Acinetobacter]|uniref:hypothetical protein n=1 Tax=unclassified Acinetobacter TaxID=196816 RepID=UPI0015D251AB|nr:MULTISPECIES: hypothetical protein [unclassified Acinetobacter]
MIKYDVSGTSNSIHLDKANNFIAVSYYDNNLISILDYRTGRIIKELKTEYCSASSNLLAGNDKYFIYQYSAKEIVVADARTHEKLHNLKVDHCGAVNSISLDQDQLLITANKKIGKHDFYSNIFLFDLTNKTGKTFTDGTKFIKKGIIKNNHIICFHNEIDSHNYLSINLDREIKDYKISDGVAEDFNIIKSNDNSLYFVSSINTGENLVNNIYEISPISGSLYPIENKFFNLQVQTGYINHTGKSFILGYDSMIKKTCLSVTKGFNSKIGNTILGATVITESIAVDDKYFAFGADHVIYLVEV